MDHLTAFAIAVAALLLPAAHARGQWEVRAMGGPGLSRINTRMHMALGRDEAQAVHHRFSWLLGATATHPITDKLAFGTGLCFSAFNGNNELWIRGNLAQEQQHRLQYMYLPLMVHFRWQGVHAGAGYQFGVPVGCTITYTSHNGWMGMADQQFSTHDQALLRADMGVVAEAGYDPGKKIGAGLRYSRGLADIRDHSDGLIDPLYTEQLVLVLSYRLLPRARPAPPVPAPAVPQPQ